MSTMLQTIQQQHYQDVRDRLVRAGVLPSWYIEMYCRHLAIILKQMHVFERCVRLYRYQSSPLNEYQRYFSPRAKIGINIQRTNLSLAKKSWNNSVCYLDSLKEYWLGNWNSTSALRQYHLSQCVHAERFYRIHNGLNAEIYRLRDLIAETKRYDRLAEWYRVLYEIRKIGEYLKGFLRYLRFIIGLFRAGYEFLQLHCYCSESHNNIDLAVIIVRFLFVVAVRYVCEILCLCHYFLGLFIG